MASNTPTTADSKQTFGTGGGADQSQPLVLLERRDAIFTLTMNGMPDNRFNPAFVDAVNAALDVVEDYALPAKGRPRACALITASASAKFYSNGLDVLYLFESGDTWFISDRYLALLKRMLLFPVITVAAINGHCFAGGLLFALCHDYRVARTDRALMSLNEIDLPSSLHPGMAAIARARLPPTTLHPLVFAAKRYGGAEAQAAGLIDAHAPADTLMQVAGEWAAKGAPKVARAGPIVSQLKAVCYDEVVNALGLRAEIDVREFMRPKM
ncbi:hypothetical protein H9P43_001259 [Blastocladiella emersonii ATCC 22665]|nr:hypothetical protein H9P43_001259 [Blastocladiella emersonii ATCC 22665]